MQARRSGLGVTIAIAAALVIATAGTAAAADEGKIAFARQMPEGGAAIFLINPDGTGEVQVPVAGLVEDFGIPVWSPDSSRLLLPNNLVLDANGECCLAFRPATLAPDGSDYVEILMPDAPGDMYCPAWAAGGERILCGFGGDTPGVVSIDADDGGNRVRLTTNPYGVGDVPWSVAPDGSQFAFLRYRPGPMPEPRPFQTQQIGIFVAGIDGSNIRQVAPFGIAMPHEFASANWSPDGKTIISSTKNGRLLVVHLDGTGLRQVNLDVPASDAFVFQPSWSPSGDRIVFAMFAGGQEDLYTASADGSNVRRLTNTPEFEHGPDWGLPPQ